jgi:hypothetical protein
VTSKRFNLTNNHQPRVMVATADALALPETTPQLDIPNLAPGPSGTEHHIPAKLRFAAIALVTPQSLHGEAIVGRVRAAKSASRARRSRREQSGTLEIVQTGLDAIPARCCITPTPVTPGR